MPVSSASLTSNNDSYLTDDMGQIEEDAEDEDKSSETYEADQSVFEDHGNKQVSPSDSVTATGRRKQHSRKVTATGHHKREATRQVGHRNWSSQAASGSRNI